MKKITVKIIIGRPKSNRTSREIIAAVLHGEEIPQGDRGAYLVGVFACQPITKDLKSYDMSVPGQWRHCLYKKKWTAALQGKDEFTEEERALILAGAHILKDYDHGWGNEAILQAHVKELLLQWIQDEAKPLTPMVKKKGKNTVPSINIADADVYVELLPKQYFREIQVAGDSKIYCVLMNDEVLRTPKGKLIINQDPRPLRELAAELDFSDKLDVNKISLFNLCCTQFDFVNEQRPSWSRDEIDRLILNDPLLKTCAGPEVAEQFKYLHVIDSYLTGYNITYPMLPQIPLEDHSWFDDAGDININRLVDHVYNAIPGFNTYQLTAFLTVVSVFDSPVLGIMLANQRISPHEFAVAYLTVQCINSKVFSDVDRKEERRTLQLITSDVECILRYINQFSPKKSEVEMLIRSGESIGLEFKSTLRKNLHTNAPDNRIEHAVLKSIVAFLNTDGGTLLVGIKDNGEVLGIQEDMFDNEDKYLLHFANLVNDNIGKQYTNLIRWGLYSIENQRVLRVDCSRSSAPVFLRMKGQEEFFIRTGPSTVPLTASEILEYSKEHFTTKI